MIREMQGRDDAGGPYPEEVLQGDFLYPVTGGVYRQVHHPKPGAMPDAMNNF